MPHLRIFRFFFLNSEKKEFKTTQTGTCDLFFVVVAGTQSEPKQHSSYQKKKRLCGFTLSKSIPESHVRYKMRD